MEGTEWLGREVIVRVETPAGGFIKRRPDGRVDLVSPWPVPFNYGCVDGEMGGDGDPLDAILLGPRVGAGTRRPVRVIGVVDFEDAGCTDLKLVCGTPHLWTEGAVRVFFAVYTPVKRLVHRWRGEPGRTRVRGTAWAVSP